MRRISIWITIFVSVAVLGFAYWLNTSGLSAKPGGENGQQPGQVTSKGATAVTWAATH